MRSDISTFARKLLLWSAPLILLLGWVECRLMRVPNGYSMKFNGLQKKGETLRVLVLGDSTALYAFKPDEWRDSSYNLAYISQSLPIDEHLLAHYLDELPHLQRLCISVAPFALDYHLQASPEAWRVGFYRRFLDVEGDDPLWTSKMDYSWLSMINLYGLDVARRSLTNYQHLLRSAPPIDSNGWQANSGFSSAVELSKSAQERAMYHQSLARRAFRPDCVRSIYTMIALARQRGVSVLLITTPLTRYYRESYGVNRIREADKILESIARQTGVPYCNYGKDDRFTNVDFNDADHLNTQGAVKFSRIVQQEVLTPRRLPS